MPTIKQGFTLIESDAQFTAGNNSASMRDGGTITRTPDTQSTSQWDYTITETDGTVYTLKPILASITSDSQSANQTDQYTFHWTQPAKGPQAFDLSKKKAFDIIVGDWV